MHSGNVGKTFLEMLSVLLVLKCNVPFIIMKANKTSKKKAFLESILVYSFLSAIFSKFFFFGKRILKGFFYSSKQQKVASSDCTPG